MTGIARIPRRRGSLCGILLVLLGAWGALIPFVGPYFHYAYSPDRAWAYSSGRLYLSILPGIAALLGGLLVLATRSRPVGVLGGFIAAAGGAWLVVGYPVILEITKKTTINPGCPDRCRYLPGSHRHPRDSGIRRGARLLYRARHCRCLYRRDRHRAGLDARGEGRAGSAACCRRLAPG